MYPLILFFTSKYCTPCKSVDKLLERVNISLFGKKLNIKKVDIENSENFQITKKFGIYSVPTIIIGDKKLTSSIDKDDLVDAILQGFLSSVSLQEE